MISKSTVGFDTLDSLKSKKPVKSNPDIYKTGIDKVDIEKLSDSELRLITEFLSYGVKKKSKVRVDKIDADKLLIMCNILANRKAETDEILFNPKGAMLLELDELPIKRKDIVLEIIGSYRCNVAYTLSELREIRLEVQKKQRNRLAKQKAAEEKHAEQSVKSRITNKVEIDTSKEEHSTKKRANSQKQSGTDEIKSKPKKRRGRPPKQSLV